MEFNNASWDLYAFISMPNPSLYIRTFIILQTIPLTEAINQYEHIY